MLTSTEIQLITELRTEMDKRPNSREKSLALTKLDECFMWMKAQAF